MHTTEEDMRAKIRNSTGIAADAPSDFHTFDDIDENVTRQLQRLRAHPWIPQRINIRGFVYDVATGRLREIKTV
jgi:carbonic anhydrase